MRVGLVYKKSAGYRCAAAVLWIPMAVSLALACEASGVLGMACNQQA